MTNKEEKQLKKVKRKSHLKIGTYVPQLGQTLEDVMRTRYPEAEIIVDKSKNLFTLKKTWLDRLSISCISDATHNASYLTFNFLSPITNGCLLQLFGIWPDILQRIVSQSFKDEVIEEIGRDLGARFRAKVEYVNKTMHPVLYFSIGAILMILLLIALVAFLINGYSYRYEYITYSIANKIELLSYTMFFWISFFIFVRKYSKPLTVFPYIGLIFFTIIGLIIIANLQLAAHDDNSSVLLQIAGRIAAWGVMAVSIFLLWRNWKNRNTEMRRTMYLP